MSSIFGRGVTPIMPIGRRQGTFPTLEPATDGSGRLYALSKIHSVLEVPAHRSIATAPDGKLHGRVREVDRENMAVIERRPNEMLILFLNQRGELESFNALKRLLTGDGIDVLQVLEAPADVIATLNKTRRLTSQQTVEHSENDITRLFDEIVLEAVMRNASDIHLQQHPAAALVRLRIHGDLHTSRQLSRDVAERLANSAYNNMGEGTNKTLNLREGQQARIERTVVLPGGESRTVQLRFQTMPVEGDFDVVMRVLQSGVTMKDPNFPALGYSPAQTAELERMLSRPRGLLLMCGPTGSGKSTTLATALAAMVRTYADTRMVRSIEDPVEYRIQGVRQTSVPRLSDEADGLKSSFMQTFTHSMRADPDVILVGETRDAKTAELLQHAVLSGHYILTSTHAASPIDALNRLAGLGLPRPILAGQDFIAGIVHQSLLGVLCSECKLPYVTLDSVDVALDARLRKRGVALDQLYVRNADRACRKCEGRGITGRTVVAQMLNMDRTLQDLFASGAPQVVLHAWWRANLYGGDPAVAGTTLLDQAVVKMEQGIVSPIDAELHLGRVDAQPSREEEATYVRDWFRRDGRTAP